MDNQPQPLHDYLLRYYRENLPEIANPQVSDLTAISDGWETEVYTYTLRQDGQPPQALILRMYPGQNSVGKSAHEFGVMRQLHAQGYMVPEVFHHCADARWLGKPFVIMERIHGRPLGQLMQEQPQDVMQHITRFCEMFVQLHRLDSAPFVAFGQQPQTAAEFLPRKLAALRHAMLDRFGQRWTLPVLDWLDKQAATVQPAPLSVLHNDFHPFNLLLTPDDRLYVIDWGSLEVGDYRADLAWTLLLSSIHGDQAYYDLLLAEYDRVAGAASEQMGFFDTLAALRRLFGMVVSVSQGGESLGMRPEAAQIIRQQAEHLHKVHALLEDRTGLPLPEARAVIAAL